METDGDGTLETEGTGTLKTEDAGTGVGGCEQLINNHSLLHCPVYWALPVAEKTLWVPHEPLHQTKLSTESILSLNDEQRSSGTIQTWCLHVTQSCLSFSASQATRSLTLRMRGLAWTITKAGQKSLLSKMTWAVNSVPLSLWSIDPERGKISMSCAAASVGRLLLTGRRTRNFVRLSWYILTWSICSCSLAWTYWSTRSAFLLMQTLCLEQGMPFVIGQRSKELQSVGADAGIFTLSP